jgi:RND family efflux transporter MFP subunit
MTRFLPAIFAFAVIEFGIVCWELMPTLGARVIAWLPGDSPSSQELHARIEQSNEEDLSLVSVIHAEGELRAAEETPVAAPVSGILDDIAYTVGTPIRAGRIIASIRPTELLARLQQIEAELRTAGAQVQQKQTLLTGAESAAERLRDLWQRDLIARQDLIRAEDSIVAARADLELARALVAQQQARVEQLRYQIRFAKVVAPFDGVITQQFSRIHTRVAQGQPIFAYASLDSLRIRISVPLAEAESIEKGLPAQITVAAFPERLFTGVIAEIWTGSAAVAATDLEVELANRGHVLRPGMRASLVIPRRAKLTRDSSAEPALS